ncbi:hypothetical protein OAP63_05740 [Vibrio sp.]|nr:hypothetical protein [Vibrio sp.]
MFSEAGILIATFIGSIFAGGYLMALNYKRLGLTESYKKSLLISTVATLLLFTIIIFGEVSSNIPNIVFTLPQIMAVYFIAKQYQKPLIEKHKYEGGMLASNWLAAGIGSIIMLIVMVILFAVIYSTMM